MMIVMIIYQYRYYKTSYLSCEAINQINRQGEFTLLLKSSREESYTESRTKSLVKQRIHKPTLHREAATGSQNQLCSFSLQIIITNETRKL